MHRYIRGIVLLALVVATSPVWAQTWVDVQQTIAIDQKRGMDPRVDYAALALIGPWDDRNYELTREHLDLLPDNDSELGQALPAFYRVLLRQWFLDQGIDVLHAYPLSALNVFRQNYGGYLIAGKYYRKADRIGGLYQVNLETEGPDIREVGMPEAFVEGDVRVTSPNGAAESAIAINPANTEILIAGSNGPLGGQRMHRSVDGGSTWNQVNLPLGGTCCDPTVEWSSDGKFGYTAALGGCSGGCDIWFYRTDDFGATWTGLENVTPGSPRRTIAGSGDREFLHVDQSPTSPHQDNIYLMWHNGNVLRCSRSLDFGNTWSTFTFSSATADRGIAGDIATDRMGRLFYAYPSFTSKTIRLRISEDGGASFGPTSVIATTLAAFSYPIPAENSRQAALYLAADADLSDGPFADSVYLVWPDTLAPESGVPTFNHSRLRVAATHDGGESWTITTPHETADAEEVDRWQPFIAVGPDGTVHVIFNDTRNSPQRIAADVYYSYSTDGAATWSVPQRVTSEMSPNIADGFEFGDYSGADIVMDDLIAIFTDNRNESGGSGDSVDVYAAGIDPGVGGRAGGIPGSLNVTGPGLLLDRQGDELILDWSDGCGPVSDYAVYAGLMSNFDVTTPRACTTDGATRFITSLATSDLFFLVVGTDAGAEGSYGQRSDGSERPPSAFACLPQGIEACD